VSNAQGPILELVERIRRETGLPVPTIPPDSPGTSAGTVLVLRDPGELGARATGVLSPWVNEDRTALNMRQLLAAAGLGPTDCLFWNAVPWHLEGRRKPTSEEIKRGARYLHDLYGLMRSRPVVVGMGNEAKRACELAGIPAIGTWHPSPLGLARQGRREEVIEALVQAKDAGSSPPQRTRRSTHGKLSRRAGRRTALFLLYQWDLTGQPLASNYEGEVDEFARALAEAVVEQADELDEKISAVSGDWPAGQLGALERNILRIGVHELEEGTVPLEVAIDEAVTLAKRYASEDAGRLVNGILGRIARDAA
jgi:N utilization substance protein B